MTTAELRSKAVRTLKTLPDEEVRVAHHFLAYLERYASDEATAELLKIPGLLEDLAEARRDQAAGKGTPVEQLRRKYQKRV
jgi:hypothetical protein